MTLNDPRTIFVLSYQIAYLLIFSLLQLLLVIENDFCRNLRFHLKWPFLTLRFWDPRCRIQWRNILKKVRKTVTCAHEIFDSQALNNSFNPNYVGQNFNSNKEILNEFYSVNQWLLSRFYHNYLFSLWLIL